MLSAKDTDIRVPEEIQQCVVFLGRFETRSDGSRMLSLQGTVFFVSITIDATDVGRQSFVYLVTARHVAEILEGKEAGIRANTPNGNARIFRIPPEMQWWYHPSDSTVDVSVLTAARQSLEEIAYKHVPTSMFLTDHIIQEKNIGTGDEVFITGMFAHVAGAARNIPIVRMGNIAMMPQERVPTRMGEIEAYLIEARSIAGLSGSPAFVRETKAI